MRRSTSDNLVPILVEGALEILREEAGTKLDRRCVLTLASLVAEERAPVSVAV
jgi:HD-GYP domain-containing protein (c-di-GMP phosphodiesterase class II)